MAYPLTPKVLIVEDDTFLAGLLTERLRRENILFDLATRGEEVLEKVRHIMPQLIILDLVLPGIDGYEVLSRLKADKNMANIPVLILSNLGQKQEIDRGMRLGASGFLIKASLDLDEIIEIINTFLPQQSNVSSLETN